MNANDGLDGAAIPEQRGVVVMDNVVQGKKASNVDLDGMTDRAAGQQDVRRNASTQNIHDAVLSKYRGRGVFLTTCILVLLAGTVMLIDRSRFSNWWIMAAVALAAFIVFIQSKNISHSYIAEAQRVMQKEVCVLNNPLGRRH